MIIPILMDGQRGGQKLTPANHASTDIPGRMAKLVMPGLVPGIHVSTD
jgi:hypothetical protein